jgi:hypothetical protein
VHATAEIERVIRAFAQGPNGGLLVLPSPTAMNHRVQIIETSSPPWPAGGVALIDGYPLRQTG